MSAATTTSFGDLLRRHRLAADLTQEALAERAGMSDRSVRALERGNNRPQKDTAQRLAAALDLRGEDVNAFLAAATPIPRHRVPDHTPPFGPLPIPATALLGRDAEVAEVGALVMESRIRVLTLTGPGGVGKTRLALEVARRMAEEQGVEAVFVSLTSLRDPDLVLSAVARALDLTEGISGPLLSRLIAALGDKHLLLVLDNFEHLLDAASDLAALRGACANLRMLVTSRISLHLQGEQVYPVRPLGIPVGYQSGPLALSVIEALSEVPAVSLFTERARSIRPDFSLTPGNSWSVAEICRNLEGLPLAIELAAARLAVLSPQALLVQLAHPLRLLTSGARDLPERQRTLRKAITWSYDLLYPEEQVLFRRLAVFAGGCELEAVDAVCTQDLPVSALDGVTALIEANLLVAEEADEMRFWMLETIREFALERLQVAGEEGEMRHRHATYYLTMAETANALFAGPYGPEQFRRLDRELDNIRAALGWSRDCGDLRTAFSLSAALFDYWYARGLQSEGRVWLEAVLALAPIGDRSPERAAALAAAGGLAILQGDFEEARHRLEESVAVWRELGNGKGLLDALSHLGLTYEGLGKKEESWAALEDSLAMAREIADMVGIGKALNGMGVQVAQERRNFGAARALFEEALIAFRAAGSKWGMAMVTNSLGDMARLQGDFVASRGYYIESLELAMELGSKSQQAISLHNLGHALHFLGREGEARDSFRQALILFRDMADRRGVAECLAGLACLEASMCPESTVRWFIAARAAGEAMGTELSASNEMQYAGALATARTALGEETFEAALAKGSIPLEVAVREALETE